MNRFIKIDLVGMGWNYPSPKGSIQDYQTMANKLIDSLKLLRPLDGQEKESRNVAISVCNEIDKIHYIEEENTRIVIPI